MSIPLRHRVIGLFLLLIGATAIGGWTYRRWKDKQTSKAAMTPNTNPSPSIEYKPETVSRAALLHFLYEFDPRADSLPKRIDPALVDRVLQEELSKGLPKRQPASQMVALANFYDTLGLVPVALAKLQGHEQSDEELASAAALTAVVGMLGTEAQRRSGRSYYYHLLSLPWAEHRFSELLGCYAAYAPQEPLEPTRQRLNALIALLAAEPEETAGTRRRDLEDLRSLTLPRIAAAANLQTEILALSAPEHRATRLIDIYLGFDERYNEVIGPWAVRQLQQLARAGHTPVIIATLRRALPRLTGRAAEEAWRARALHAIEFFGGTLSAEEQLQVRSAYKRYDPLSLD
jgi:hypothetical protein